MQRAFFSKNKIRVVIVAMLLLSLTACGAARRQQEEAAIQAHQREMKETQDEIAAALRECYDKRMSGELKTYVASVRCSNPRIIAAQQKARYSYMDLVMLFTTKRMILAEKADKKKITEGEYQVKSSEALTELINEERRRNLENMSANNQTAIAKAAQTQANVAAEREDRQKWDSLIERGNRMMNPPPPPVQTRRPTNCVVNEPFNAPWAKTTISCD